MILRIENNPFKIKIAKTKKQIKNGMGFQTFNSDFNGMLFILKKDEHCFWMKNCIIPLDIIFIENKKIKKIYHNCLPCTKQSCDNFCGFGDMVLEIPGGTCKKLNIIEDLKVSI